MPKEVIGNQHFSGNLKNLIFEIIKNLEIFTLRLPSVELDYIETYVMGIKIGINYSHLISLI